MNDNSTKVQNKGYIPAFTLVEKARERAGQNRVTDLYTFGDNDIDEYMGGGWGRHGAYELICVYGGTGQNKSTLLSQMALGAAASGAEVAYLALEDEMEDVVNRMDRQIPGSGLSREAKFNDLMTRISFFPDNDGYSLSSLADFIEATFKNWDVVLIDPIQFVFEASVVENGETEWNRQRLFMRRLNNIMKKSGKTLVFVSHTNKSSYRKGSDGGLADMQGSGALPQIATKIIEVKRDNETGARYLRLHKTRFTRHRVRPLPVVLTDNLRIGADWGGVPAEEVRRYKESW